MAASSHQNGSESTRIIYQPLDPNVRLALDPEYVALHDDLIQYIEPDDVREWDPVQSRSRKLPGNSEPVPVQVEDIQRPNFPLRVFWPHGSHPDPGWPVLVWFHGGGWAVGSIESENDFCSRMCRGMCEVLGPMTVGDGWHALTGPFMHIDATCVVVTVGYRLAPEHPYPAAVQDSVEALTWVHSQEGRRTLGIDAARIAIGGTSAYVSIQYLVKPDLTVVQEAGTCPW